MESHTNDHRKEEEGLYKGLFFGVLIGVGLVLFLNSKTGKEFVEKARQKIDEALLEEPEEDYEESADETVVPPESTNPDLSEKSEETVESSEPQHRFFEKKEE